MEFPFIQINKYAADIYCHFSVAFIVEKHHKAYSHWKDRFKRGTLTQPSHILHVDEHCNMME